MASLYQAQHPVRFSCCSNKTLFTDGDPVATQRLPLVLQHTLVRTKHHISLWLIGLLSTSTVGSNLHRVLVLARTGAREGRGSRGRQEQCSDPVAGLSSWRREGVVPLYLRAATYTNISQKLRGLSGPQLLVWLFLASWFQPAQHVLVF